MLVISRNVSIPDHEIQISAIRSQGSGGQNVNKVSSAIHLRFDIQASSLPDFYKQRLLKLNDRRISREGVIIIKAQRYRDQQKNILDALERLKDLVVSVGVTRKKRIPTKPSRASQQRRLDSKSRHSRQKQLRRKLED